MKPLKTASFFLILLLVIVGFSYFNHTASFMIGTIKVQLPTRKHLLTHESSASIPQFLDQQHPVEEPLKSPQAQDMPVVTDTLKVSPDTLSQGAKDTDSIHSVDPDTLLQPQSMPLVYRMNSKGTHPLARFYDALSQTSYQQIRILHYGDSQIEGDRITAYLRNQLQETFGGSGIGLLPIELTPGTHTSLLHKPKGQWERYTLYDLRKKNIHHNRLGVLFSYCAFSSYSHMKSTATLTLEPSPLAFNRINNYNQVRLFYGQGTSPIVVQLACNDTLYDADLLSPQRELQEIKWQLPAAPKKLEFRFTGESSPEFYGVSLESPTGVVVDNIPLRGSSGTDFTRVDKQLQQNLYKTLDPDIFLLQFGVNLVPHLTTHFDYYEQQLRQQIKRIKEVAPNAAIVLLGVSDMAHKKEGFYQSYENIESIRAIQKKVALETGALFWDTYEAMGGKNAMVKWVDHKPPLGRKDYTHFSYRGATLMAELFYESLMNDYDTYRKQK